MDLRTVKKLVELIENSTIAEIEIRQGEETLRLRRESAAGAPPPAAVAAAPAPAPASAPAPAAAEEETAPGEHVKSPMVGTFYRSPSPDKPAFVSVGDRVEASQTLCIIEAMKTMNQIEAPVAGKITRILAENGHPVEFGQTLFVIE